MSKKEVLFRNEREVSREEQVIKNALELVSKAIEISEDQSTIK